MKTPIKTTSYDHVVIIDSQVILEAKPLQQLPWGEIFQGSILLLVVRQVQTEIDRKKRDGRLGKRARAFNKLLDGFIVDRVPSSVMTSPKVDVATVANRSIDWGMLDDLDRDDPDDRVVAQALNALVDDPTRLVLLSHDMRPRDAATIHGLNALKLPDTWLMDPEPSPNEKKIRELQAKIKLLASDQPELAVRLEPVTPMPWRYREVARPKREQLYSILNSTISSAPPESQRGPFNMALGDYDDSHSERLAAWRALMRADIPLMHQGLTKLYAQHRIRVIVANVGSISAEGLSLEVRSGNVILHSIPYWVLVNGPAAPQPRRFYEHFQGLNSKHLTISRNEPFSFYWDEERPGDHLIKSCASFRQGKEAIFEVSIELRSKTPPKAQIEAIVTASNMKGDVRKQMLVDVERIEVPFDDAFDAVEGKLKLFPLVDPRSDPNICDITKFRNNGKEYKPD